MSSLILPIDAYLVEIKKIFLQSQNMVLSAAPGSGKTTRVPPAILEWTKNKILVLEPRRVAALAAASRIAEENSWTLGKEVGYQVRFENKSQPSTRLKFLTEALLVRQMLSDPQLSQVDVVILDEFHERSSHVDLALGLLRELQQMGHPIKIIVMSATLDSQKISKFLGQAPVIEVPGKLFDMQIEYDQKSQHLRIHEEFYHRLIEKIKIAANKSTKDILVFLPGVGEIHKLELMLSPWVISQNKILQTLYAAKPLSEQKKVLLKTDQQRIILSTNIAESALTIDGVGVVIDSGLERRVEFDDRTETEKISLQRISKASAIQRSGRSARQYPGLSIRLWSKTDELSFQPQIPAEILKIDLSSVLLFLSAQGISNFEEFTWFEKPATKSILWAQKELQQLGALDLKNQLTGLGRKMLDFPVPPRLAKLLVLGQEEGIYSIACELVSLIQEKDILNQTLISSEHQQFESDILERWSLWKENSKLIHRPHLENVIRSSESLEKIFSRSTNSKNELMSIQKILMLTFADRLCHRRTPGSAKGLKLGGRGVNLDSSSVVKKSDFFIPLKSIDLETQNETLVSWAHGFTFEQIQLWLGSEIQKKTQVIFDNTRKRVVRQTQTYFRDLALDEPRISEPSAEEIQEHFPEVIQSFWPELVKNNIELNRWMARYDYFKQSESALQFGESFTEEIFKQVCEEIAMGHSNLREIESMNIVSIIESKFSSDLKLFWQKEWPLIWQAPGGRRIFIEYQIGQKPFVEIKIQELFGLKKNPTLFGNNSPLVFHLLAPNQRPVQVTSDIVGFWSGSYKDVKKELKARYPKHSWPEDPMNEAPEPPKFRR